MNNEIIKRAIYIAAAISIIFVLGNMFKDTYDFKVQSGLSSGFKINKRNGTLEWCDVGTSKPSGKTVIICIPEHKFNHEKYLKSESKN